MGSAPHPMCAVRLQTLVIGVLVTMTPRQLSTDSICPAGQLTQKPLNKATHHIPALDKKYNINFNKNTEFVLDLEHDGAMNHILCFSKWYQTVPTTA